MGIVERELANFDLDGDAYRIEYNERNVVHVHVDGVRIELSVAEFDQFVDGVLQARRDLRRRKGR